MATNGLIGMNLIDKDLRSTLSSHTIQEPIGKTAVVYSHNTLQNMSENYQLPVWKVPDCIYVEPGDRSTISGNRAQYE
jgi:hypothetical protein